LECEKRVRVAAAREITEHDRRSELYHTVVQTAMDGFWITDISGRFLDVNDAYCRMIGYNRAELLQMSVQDVELEENREETVRRINTIMQRGSDRFETCHRRKDGQLIDVEVSTKYLALDGGRLVAFLHDITQRKRLGEKLRQSEERYRSLFDRMLDGVYLSTHTGRFVDVNPAFVRMFRYSSKQEMLRIQDIKKELYFSPEERGSHILDTGQQEVEVYRMRRKDGSEIWVEDHGRYIHDDQGNIVYHEGILRDVTERKRLEEELKQYSLNLEKLIEERTRKLAESEKRFRDFADLLPMGAFETDEDGVFTFVNHVALASTGYTEDDVRTGVNLFQLVPLEEYAKVSESLGRQKERDPICVEFKVRRKDGSVFPALVYAGAIVRDGKVIGFRGTVVDIWERKRMEEDLQTARQRLEHAVTTNPAAIYTAKPLPDYSDWHLTYLSDRVTTMLGFEPEEFIGHPEFWENHVHKDDLSPTMMAIPWIFKEGGGATDYRFRHKNGTYRWIRDEARIIRDSYGRPIEVNGYWIDITELKRSEEATRESEARYRRLFENSPISLWEEDFSEVKNYFESLRGRGINDLREYLIDHPDELSKCASMVKILDVNETTLKLYGATSVEELFGELSRVLTRESLDNFREELVALWDDKTMFSSEFENQTFTGETKHVSLILNVAPGHEDTLAKVLVSIIDLTERKQMEQRLQQAERLAAVGETAAMVGHDLRNPLQGIAGALHLLEEESLTAEERKEMLQVIRKSLDYSDSIVRDLSEYSAEIQLKLRETTPRSLIQSSLKVVKVPGNVVVYDSSEEPMVIRADSDAMSRVFINLIQNSIDAMPQGGTLRISSNKSSENVEITFTDTGSGMSENVMRNLWKPLQTTKAKGLGLGLAICKRIVDAHGGTISVKSKVSEGTTVTIRLPIEPDMEVKKN
jgi:PAS domain S-box-containing protein